MKLVKLLLISTIFHVTVPLRAEDYSIPNDYELGEDTLSPNKNYGILYPLAENSAANEESTLPNLLVRFNPYQVLAKIQPGVSQGVTTSLSALWNGNSMVALYHFRQWGITSLQVYEIPESGPVKMQDVLGAAREIFRKDIREKLLKEYPNENETIIFVSSEGEANPSPEFEFHGHQFKLDLYADNRANLAEGPYWSARLKANWDLNTGKFTQIKLKSYPIKIYRNP